MQKRWKTLLLFEVMEDFSHFFMFLSSSALNLWNITIWSPGFFDQLLRKKYLISLLAPAATLHTSRRVVGSRSFMASRDCSMIFWEFSFHYNIIRSLYLYLDSLIPEWKQTGGEQRKKTKKGPFPSGTLLELLDPRKIGPLRGLRLLMVEKRL